MPADPTLAAIQTLWVRGPLSRMELLCVRSFLAHGHAVHLYHYGDIPNAPHGVTLLDGAEILPARLAPLAPTAPMSKGSMTTFSNYFRYHLLHARGGWWTDMDVVCTRPWRFDRPATTAATIEGHHGRIANNCVMHFTAGHPVRRACVESCAGADWREVPWGKTGPVLVHETLKAQGQLAVLTDPSVFCPVPWNASWQLTGSFWSHFTPGSVKQKLVRRHLSPRFTRQTVAVYLWSETWRKAGRDKDGRYPASSLYERLQKQWNP